MIILAFIELRLILSCMCIASLVGNGEDEQTRPPLMSKLDFSNIADDLDAIIARPESGNGEGRAVYKWHT
jgi:hypothetical protein